MLESDDLGVARYGDVPPKFAYHLEGQAIAVREAQLANRLRPHLHVFTEFKSVEEFGHTWYFFNHAKLFSGDCNEDVINSLVRGVQFTEVIDTRARPDVFDGRPEYPIAAIFYEGGVIYKSPGFDWEAYENKPDIRQNPVPQKEMPPPRIRISTPKNLIGDPPIPRKEHADNRELRKALGWKEARARKKA